MMQPNFLPAVNAGKLGTVFGQVFLMQSNSPMYYLTKFMKEATKNFPSSVQYLYLMQKTYTGLHVIKYLQILVLLQEIDGPIRDHPFKTLANLANF